MREVGSSRRPRLVAVGSRTSTQVTGASYSDSMVSSFACLTSTSPVRPWSDWPAELG
jgi:hypothetical protein